MSKSRFSGLSRNHFLGLGLLSLLFLVLMASPARSQAADQPFKITFDKDEVKIGLIGSLPFGAETSGGSIEGTVDANGNVTIPPENFVFPVYGLTDPLSVQAYMSISQPATGTWDATTGQLVLNAKAGIFLKINIGETLGALEGLGLDLGDSLGPLGALLNGDLACGFSPMDVTFTTEGDGGARFTKGTLGPGAIAAEWAQLGKFAGQSGVGLSSFACPLIKSYAPTLLEGLVGGSLPDGIDLGGLDLASLLDNLDNLNLGDSSLTLTRSLDENPIDVDPPVSGSPNLKLSVTPKKRKVKAGRKAEFTVKVKNSGDAPASGVKVCLKTSGPVVLKGKRCRTLGSVMAGATQTRRFRVKAKSHGKKSARIGFRLSSTNTTGSSTGIRLLIRR